LITAQSDRPSAGVETFRVDWRFAGAVLAVLALLTVLFGHWTATSAWSFPQFVVVTWIAFYIPGLLLMSRRPHDMPTVERAAIALALGIASGLVVYVALRLAGVPDAWFWIWPAATTIIQARRRLSAPRVRITWDGTVGVPIWLLLGLLAAQFAIRAGLEGIYPNLVRQPNGTMVVSVAQDALFHVPVAQELTHALPPQAPFFAGHPLSYHFASDLVASSVASIAGLSVLDLSSRFVPTLFVTLTVLATFAFSTRWVGSAYAGVAGAALLFFGDDFSFIPGLLLHRDFWSLAFLQNPATFSLYWTNPLLPALGMLQGAFLCLWRYDATSSPRWMWIAAALIAATAEFKMFTALQAAFALGMTGLVFAVWYRRRTMLSAAVATAVLLAPLLLYQAMVAQSVGGVVWQARPWPYVPQMMALFGWPHGMALSLAMGLPVYLFLSFGLGLLGVAVLGRSLVRPAASGAMAFLLAVFVIVGIVVSLTTRVFEATYPPERQYNNAIWFIVHGKQFMWLFALAAVWPWIRGRSTVVASVVLLGGIAIASISTAEFLYKTMTGQAFQSNVMTGEGPPPIARHDVEMLDGLRTLCKPGEVVFARATVARHVVMLTPCRVPFAMDDYAPVMALDQVRLRMRDQDDFWSAWRQRQVRWDILDRYSTRFVVVTRGLGDLIEPMSGTRRLIPRWTSDNARVFEVGR